MEQGGQGEGTASSHSSPEEKLSDNISSASEASETTSGSQYLHKKNSNLASGYWGFEVFHWHDFFFCLGLLHSSSTATDICFSRQADSSEVDSQSFPGADGNVTALRPGAIDNQPLVTSEPLKVSTEQYYKTPSHTWLHTWSVMWMSNVKWRSRIILTSYAYIQNMIFIFLFFCPALHL